MTITVVTAGVASGVLEFEDVALEGDDVNTITDAEVLARLARYYDQPESEYEGYVVDRHPVEGGGVNFVVRKRAVYGESDEEEMARRLGDILGDGVEEDPKTAAATMILTTMLEFLVKSAGEANDHLNEIEKRLAWLEGAAGKK